MMNTLKRRGESCTESSFNDMARAILRRKSMLTGVGLGQFQHFLSVPWESADRA